MKLYPFKTGSVMFSLAFYFPLYKCEFGEKHEPPKIFCGHLKISYTFIYVCRKCCCFKVVINTPFSICSLYSPLSYRDLRHRSTINAKWNWQLQNTKRRIYCLLCFIQIKTTLHHNIIHCPLWLTSNKSFVTLSHSTYHVNSCCGFLSYNMHINRYVKSVQ